MLDFTIVGGDPAGLRSAALGQRARTILQGASRENRPIALADA